MTDIEQKALALVNEACKSDFKDLGLTYRNNVLDALLLAIEQHEAFRQEVSDALEGQFIGGIPDKVRPFIIPKPVDPLVEAVTACGYATLDAIEPEFANALRQALAESGHGIAKIGEVVKP